MKRRDLLADLITARFSGSQKEFAKAIGRSPAQVSQWLTGHRALGDAGARVIENALRLPQGFFDGPTVIYYPTAHTVAEPTAQPPGDPLIRQVVALMESTDATGRAMALAAVKVALSGYRPVKAKSAS